MMFYKLRSKIAEHYINKNIAGKLFACGLGTKTQGLFREQVPSDSNCTFNALFLSQ